MEPATHPTTAGSAGDQLGATDRTTVQRRLQWSALVALAVIEALVGVALAMEVSSGLSFGQLLLSYGVTNAWLAGTFAPFGALVAYRRPRLPIGWLFLAFSVLYALSAVGIAMVTNDEVVHHGVGVTAGLVTFADGIWTPAVGICFPLILLLFPSGQLAPGRARWLAGLALLDGTVWVVAWTLTVQYGLSPFHGVALTVVTRVQTVSNYGILAVFVACLTPIMRRWRLSVDRLHDQLVWLAIGSTVAVGLFLPTGFGVNSYWATGLLIGVPLFPAACAVALLRHRLFGLDIALNRGLVYGTLSGGVFAIYLVIVELARVVVGSGAELGGSIVAAALVAVVFAPSRSLVQRAVTRVMFGTRGDPARTLTSVAATLEASVDDDLLAAVGAVSTSLRLPHARLAIEGRMVGTADPERAPECFMLRFKDREVGELEVWPRRGQSRLDAADREAIRMLSGPLATAVHAVALTEQVQRAQLQLIASRRLERERLHRDLHDGLGPMLTGVALKADAAGNLAASDSDRAGTLMGQVAGEARLAIVEVRRIAHDLRPPTLDRNGLLESLAFEATRFASRLDGHPLHVSTDFPPTLPTVPSSVSTATYRIATEALTNIARHSNASGVSMAVRVLESADRCALTLTVSDNGSSPSSAWPEGFGLASMRHRVEECGGTFAAGPSPDGGCVRVEFPLPAPSAP